jgi:hypothetical protein
MNYAMGNDAGNALVSGFSSMGGGGIHVNVGGVSVSSNNPNIDQKALQHSIRGAITDQLLREQRPGGILA